MPDFCENKLFVRGNRKEMDRFLELSRDKNGVFKLNGTYKIPEILEEDSSIILDERDPIKIEKYKNNTMIVGHRNKYDWCNENWGTTFDVDGHIEYRKNYVEITFDSAWKPPIEWFIKVSLDFPKLIFQLEYKGGAINREGIAYAHGNKYYNQKREIMRAEFWEDFNKEQEIAV